MKKYQLKYHVIALSQCEELESSQTVGVFDTELKALEFMAENRSNYWNTEIRKHCAGCGRNLEECRCNMWN